MVSNAFRPYCLRKTISGKGRVCPSGAAAQTNGARSRDRVFKKTGSLQALAAALGVKVSDFAALPIPDLVFRYNGFHWCEDIRKDHQEQVLKAVEDHFHRFYTALQLLGEDVLPSSPECRRLTISDDMEANALAMRLHLGLARIGPIHDLIGVLEDRGILVCMCSAECSAFSGTSGFVNGRPFVALNRHMSPEQSRTAIAFELVRLLFDRPDDMDARRTEEAAAEIGEAFLFPAHDAMRELGVLRGSVTRDMALVCREYGVSMYLLARQAQRANIISETSARSFCIRADALGWRSTEPSRIEPETPLLFEQLVSRAVNERVLSAYRGAELLDAPHSSAG